MHFVELPLTPPSHDSSSLMIADRSSSSKLGNCHPNKFDDLDGHTRDWSPEYSNSEISSPSSQEDVFMSDFTELIADIKTIMGPSSGLDASDVDVEHLMERIKDYISSREDWSKYAYVDEAENYTRNGVDDINSKANLLILVWTPGKGSAIHDHANAHCIVKILEGSLRETLFEMPESGASSDEHFESHELKVKRVSDYKRNEVSYMSDDIGLHRMQNVGVVPAVSLHLYTPPFAAKFGCHIYDEHSGSAQHVGMSTLYSNRGVKIVDKPCTC